MNAQVEIDYVEKPQWERVLEMLKTHQGGVTTGMFCSTHGLAAEYRRAISELRKKGHKIVAQQIAKGCFNYTLEEK